jgi:hypothetical protein
MTIDTREKILEQSLLPKMSHSELRIGGYNKDVNLASPAYQRLRKRSHRLGRPSRISQEQCQILVSPTRNPVRDQLYEAQIKHHKLDIKPRQLQRRLKGCANEDQRYKQAYIQKVLSTANKEKRLEYCQEHKDKSIDNFRQYIFFTDEPHIDPSSMRQGHILRKQGHRYDTENTQQKPEVLGVRIHCAAWCNWHGKAEKLEFDNDENDYIQRPKRPPKPRKTMYESQADYDMCIIEWYATLRLKSSQKGMQWLKSTIQSVF